MDIITYFVQGQVPVAICAMATVATLHFFVQRWFDKRDIASGRLTLEISSADAVFQRCLKMPDLRTTPFCPWFLWLCSSSSRPWYSPGSSSALLPPFLFP